MTQGWIYFVKSRAYTLGEVYIMDVRDTITMETGTLVIEWEGDLDLTLQRLILILGFI